MSSSLSTVQITRCLDNTFIQKMVELFDSEDPRERDYLKTILHRIYGKYMGIRTYIRLQVQNLLLRVTYEVEDHNGLSELFEIFSSIVNGFIAPLKQEHKDFFQKVLIPIHKVKSLSNFHGPLMQNIKHLIEKDHQLAVQLIIGLLRIWPITNPAKESVFLNEIEEIMELQP